MFRDKYTIDERWKQYGALIFQDPKAGRKDFMFKIYTGIFLGFCLGVPVGVLFMMWIK